MNKELPKYHETYIQILKVLQEGEDSKKNVARKVRDTYYSDLPKELLNEKISSGESKILNRIQWGIVYLGLGKFVESTRRGFTRITDKGKQACQKGELTRQAQEQDPDFQKYREEKVAQEKLNNTSIVDTNLFTNTDKTPQELIDTSTRSIESEIKDTLLVELKKVDPHDFEEIVLKLLKKMGYGEYIPTGKSSDGGVDGIINEDELGLSQIYIQAKRFTDSVVGEKDIRNFIGAMSGDTTKGVFVTTSQFSGSAKQKARDAHHAIILIDGNKLAELMYHHNLGVQIKHTYEIKGIDSDFFDT